jgi:hypothetical protein
MGGSGNPAIQKPDRLWNLSGFSLASITRSCLRDWTVAILVDFTAPPALPVVVISPISAFTIHIPGACPGMLPGMLGLRWQPIRALDEIRSDPRAETENGQDAGLDHDPFLKRLQDGDQEIVEHSGEFTRKVGGE